MAEQEIAPEQVTWYQGINPDLLPRYTFTETGVGCEAHSDPNCLCDVNIDNPMAAEAVTILFSDIAKQALGAATVSSANIYDWAELVLGLHDKYRELGITEPDRSIQIGVHKGNTTPWSCLPDDVRRRMVDGYYAKVPWSIAATWLPPMSKEDRKAIYKYYNQRLYAKNTQRKPANV